MTIKGVDINIGPTEYRMLELFLRNPNRVFERDQLLDRVWGRSQLYRNANGRRARLRLRKVLKPFGLDRTVQTVRSVGYRFTPIK